MLINPKFDNGHTSPPNMESVPSRMGDSSTSGVDGGSKSGEGDSKSRELVYISVDDFYQSILFLCKSLESTARTAQLRLRVETFLASVKAAEEKFKSSMQSGIVTIAILAPGVAFSAYLLAGAKGFSFKKGAGIGSINPHANKPKDTFAQGNQDKDGAGGSSLHRDSVSSQPDGSTRHRDSVSSQRDDILAARRDSLNKAEANKTDEKRTDEKRTDEKRTDEKRTNGKRTDENKDSARPGHKGPKHGHDHDRRGAFQGMSMFILPSGSSAAGEMAGAADQRNSDISQAVSKVISDHQDTLRDLIAEYGQTVKSVLDGFRSS